MLKQLPVIDTRILTDNNVLFKKFFACCVELVYTSWDLYPWVRNDLKMNIPPYRWDSERRHKLEALINAIAAFLYGVDDTDLDFILETFPGYRNDEIQQYGRYRMKEEILECFDIVRKLAVGKPSGLENFLSPSPGDPSQRHPFPSRKEAETMMPWIDWSRIPSANQPANTRKG